MILWLNSRKLGIMIYCTVECQKGGFLVEGTSLTLYLFIILNKATFIKKNTSILVKFCLNLKISSKTSNFQLRRNPTVQSSRDYKISSIHNH